jgi:hypothetical protein
LETGDTGQSTGTSSLTAATTTKLSNVEVNMVPGSLALPGTALRLMADQNTCAGTSGFLDCQPNLLKVYMNVAKLAVQLAGSTLSKMDLILSALSGKGQFVEPTSAQTVHYDITDEAAYHVLTVSSLGPTLEVKVAGDRVRIKHDDANNTGKTTGERSKIDIDIDYKSTTEFIVDVRVVQLKCDASDIRAPEGIRVKVWYKDGIRTGKAQMYSPRWFDTTGLGSTCDTTPTSLTKAFMFTDFVGDDTSTTAALYLMTDAVVSKSAIQNWSIDQMPTNFASTHPLMCSSNGSGDHLCLADPNPVSGYRNNFCVVKNASHTWNTSCSSTSTLISGGTFLPTEDWELPAGMQSLFAPMPAAL